MNRNRTYNLVSTAIFAAILGVIAPLSIPLTGLVPISLATFIIYLLSAVLGYKKATVGVVIYILIGVVGIPVFSGYSAGVSVLVGPTGGYIAGYIFMAFSTGFASDKFGTKFAFSGMIAGTLITYAIGTLWYSHVVGLSFVVALSSAVLPFVIVDCIKIAVANLLAFPIKKGLSNF